MGIEEGIFKNRGNKCQFVEDDMVVFEKSFGRYYFIRTKLGYAKYAGAN